MNDNLEKMSDALANAAEKASASVVRVDARHRIPATGIVWSDDGLIVTAHHVVSEEEEIEVGLPDGESVSAVLVGRDPSSDLALMRAEASGLNVPDWLDEEAVKTGQLVLAVGRPGDNVQASLGVVRSAEAVMRTRRTRRSGSRRRGKRGTGRSKFWMHRGPRHGHHVRDEHHGHEHDHIRTHRHHTTDSLILPDLVMYPGFSGGPLVAADGGFIGMNTSAMFRGGALTIPYATINRVAGTLQEHGRMRQGYLGISAQPARLPDGIAADLDQETGLLVVSVEPDSPAARAELLLGDTIVSLDGIPTETLEDLLGLLTGERVGKEVPIVVLRGGEMKDMNIMIGERM